MQLNKKVAVITLDDGLVEQYKEYFESAQLKGITATTYDDQDFDLTAYDFIVFDEYYDCLRGAKLKILLSDIPLVFRVTDCNKKALFMTHQDTVEFHSFLSRLMNKEVAWVNEENFNIVQREQPGGKVKCSLYVNEDMQTLRKAALVVVQKLNETVPVIVFGLNDQRSTTEESAIKEYQGEVRFVDTLIELRRARQAILQKDRGVVFLSNNFTMGADMKFKKNAVVVVVTSSQIETSTLK